MRKFVVLFLLGALGLMPGTAVSQSLTRPPYVDCDSQFGGRGDGVTDNAAALNAYYAWACNQPAIVVNHVTLRPAAMFKGAPSPLTGAGGDGLALWRPSIGKSGL